MNGTFAIPRRTGMALLGALASICAVTLAVNSPAAELTVGVDMASIDNTVRPQDNFYQYANGGWLAKTAIPADKPRYGAFNELQDKTLEQLRVLIDETAHNASATDPEQRKIADLYASFMNESALVGKGIAPLGAELKRIDSLTSARQLADIFAHLDEIGVASPIASAVAQDDKDSAHYAVVLNQSGLGLPDRDYYLKDDAKFKDVREKYAAHIVRLLTLAGAGQADAQSAAKSIVAIESDLAKVQWSRVDNRDPAKTYNRIDVEKLIAQQPDVDWKAYFDALGVSGRIHYVIARQPSYFAALSSVISDHPLQEWKTYLRFRVISTFSPYLESAYVDEAFAFNGTVLQGTPVNRPRWKRALNLVETSMGEALGKLYVGRHFQPEAKARMDRLVGNLLAAYREDVATLDWMGPETRRHAQEKLATFMPKIGYPVKWRDYSGLKVDAGDLVGNVIRSSQFETAYAIAKLGKPVDRTEWMMTPQTINAYYNATLNEIVFPAAILQPPFFNFAADDAVNYGAIGAVIGHEISHGFDDEGSQYGADGNLMETPGWFTKDDLEKFHARTHALVAQYDAQEPLPGHHVNGSLTLGENIADNSGLAIAYKAYHRSLGGKEAPVINGLTGDQRLYLGWAQAWRNKTRDENALMLLTVDPHSPASIRGSLPLRNQPAFYEAFGVKPGDKMYFAPEQRVQIW